MGGRCRVWGRRRASGAGGGLVPSFLRGLPVRFTRPITATGKVLGVRALIVPLSVDAATPAVARLQAAMQQGVHESVVCSLEPYGCVSSCRLFVEGIEGNPMVLEADVAVAKSLVWAFFPGMRVKSAHHVLMGEQSLVLGEGRMCTWCLYISFAIRVCLGRYVSVSA